MARCGCATACSCLLVAGDHVTITGNGSTANPYEITADALNVEDENVLLSADVTLMDFQGAGVTSALGGVGEVVVTIPGYTDEQARDAVGTALVAGANITIVVDDALNTITISGSAAGVTRDWTTRAVTTTQALTAADEVILASNTITLTLPAVGTFADDLLTIKNIGTGTITITPASGTIDGFASRTLTVQYSSVGLVTDGVNWWEI